MEKKVLNRYSRLVGKQEVFNLKTNCVSSHLFESFSLQHSDHYSVRINSDKVETDLIKLYNVTS